MVILQARSQGGSKGAYAPPATHVVLSRRAHAHAVAHEISFSPRMRNSPLCLSKHPPTLGPGYGPEYACILIPSWSCLHPFFSILPLLAIELNHSLVEIAVLVHGSHILVIIQVLLQKFGHKNIMPSQ